MLHYATKHSDYANWATGKTASATSLKTYLRVAEIMIFLISLNLTYHF